MEKLAWVRGNDVVLAVTLLRKYTDSAGELHEKAVDFNTVSNLEVTAVNSYGRRFALETALKHGDSSALLVTIPYTMKEETYALDMKFERDGIHERSCEAFTFKIVSSNEQANVTFQELDGYKSTDLNIKHRMMSLAVKTGQSAYQAWLAAGNTGTLDDYVYYLYEQGTAAKEAAEAAKDIVAVISTKKQELDTLAGEVSANLAETTETLTSVKSVAESVESGESSRAAAEQTRVAAEKKRNGSETDRISAEERRAQSELDRTNAEEERKTKIAHLESLLEYIKDNHLEGAVAIAEAVKNAPKEGNWVYLDSADGNVKTKPIADRLPSSTAAIYYIAPYFVPMNFSGFSQSGIPLIQSLDFSGWDFMKCTSLQGFTAGFSGLRQLLFKKNTTLENVQTMQSAFHRCHSLQAIDASSWTLANVQTMVSAFDGCSSLRSIDLSKCTFENVQNVSSMFDGCSALRNIDMRNANITHCSNFSLWLLGCNELTSIKIGLIDISRYDSINSHALLNQSPVLRSLTGTLRGIHLDFVVSSRNMNRESVLVVLHGLDVVSKKTTLTLSNNNKPVSLGGVGNDPITDEDFKIATDKGWTVVFV